jgi:hypothetical protein
MPIKLTQIASQSLAETQAMVLDGLDKRQLVVLTNGTDILYTNPECTFREDGQIESMVQSWSDLVDGTPLGSREIDWTYYDTGEVDTITTTEYDGDGNETRNDVIKHFTDGRQPIINLPVEIAPLPIEKLPPVGKLGEAAELP